MITLNDLILYRGFHNDDVLNDMVELINTAGHTVKEECASFYRENQDRNTDTRFVTQNGELYYMTWRQRELFFRSVGRLVELAEKCGFSGNLWHDYLTFLLVNHENAYSTRCEITGGVSGSINEIALHDLHIFKKLFDYDLSKLGEKLHSHQTYVLTNYTNESCNGILFNSIIRERVMKLSVRLAQSLTDTAFKLELERFYRDFGVGRFGLNKAFRVNNESGHPEIVPIQNILQVSLDDLVGYEIAKKKLIENTEAFLAGRSASNCLLYGEAGTGKSSSIKGILNRYYERGLRIIEIYKHNFRDLNDIIGQIKNRNYKFILYMDDLSFEETETEYKYLKALIEGGLELRPKNILIYATSNRRHLIRENYSDKLDRSQDMHTSDTVQEKLSLAYRFGVSIYFGSPNKAEFDEIVTVLADRNGITMDRKELLLEANKWELAHGGYSGRTAQQFIDHILGSGKY